VHENEDKGERSNGKRGGKTVQSEPDNGGVEETAGKQASLLVLLKAKKTLTSVNPGGEITRQGKKNLSIERTEENGAWGDEQKAN